MEGTYEASEFHNGTDHGMPTGTPVYAAQNGVVRESIGTFAENTGTGNGNFIRISYEDGTQGVYLQLKSTSVTPGTPITVGEQIGLSNNAGRSSEPHLHYSLWKHQNGGSTSDPNNFHDPEVRYSDC